MQLIVFVGASVDPSFIADIPSGAVQLELSNHGRIKVRIRITIIVLPETCALIVYLTAGSAVEGLKKGHVKWFEFTPVQ